MDESPSLITCCIRVIIIFAFSLYGSALRATHARWSDQFCYLVET